MTGPSLPAARADNVPLGIGMMLLAVFLFSIMNVLVKTLTAGYSINQVVFFRSVFALLPVLAMLMATPGGFAGLRTRRPLGHLWRGTVGFVAIFLTFWSFGLLPLADAVSITFAAPLIMTALAQPVLGEKVGVHRWSAVLVGFAGVLLIVQPDGHVFTLGALVALSAAFGQAVAMITVRHLSRTEPPVTIVFWLFVLTSTYSGVTLPWTWQSPTLTDWGLFILTGVVGGGGQLCLTKAFSLAPAGSVSPFNYTQVLWAALFGWILWDHVPADHVVLGAAVVAASGLYILHRETRRKRPVVQATPPSSGD